jgi:hypothetical protein
VSASKLTKADLQRIFPKELERRESSLDEAVAEKEAYS